MKIFKNILFFATILGITSVPVISIGEVAENNVQIDQNKIEELTTQTQITHTQATTQIDTIQTEQIEITIEQKQHFTYSFKNVEKYDNNLVYKIKYVKTNDNIINQKIDDYIQYLAQNFKNDFSNFDMTNDDKMYFNLDTEISTYKEKLLFVKFSIERNYNTYPNPVKFYETMILDLETKQDLQIENILKEGYTDLFYIDAKKYFYNNYGINITKKSENYNDIKPDETVYKKMFLKEDITEIFIYDYKKQKEIIFNIPTSEILPYIKTIYLETTTTTTETTTETTTITTTETSTEATTQTLTQNKTLQINSTRKIDKNKKMIALTFDDGPNGANTNEILDILEKNNSVATFFVVSRRLDADKKVLKRMVDLGCQIGNHTANHKDLTKLSDEQIKAEVDLVSDKIKNITGNAPTIVRVPYGAVNDNVTQNIDYPIIMWNIDTKDWKTKNVEAIKKEVLGKVKDGDIILMHDLYKTTKDACKQIIPALIEQGFQLVTVDELLYYRDIEPQAGVKYFNAYKK